MMNDEPKYEVLREVWIITEMRDGAVFKTEYSHEAWVPMGVHGIKGECVYATLSRDIEFTKTIRRKAE